MHYTNPRLITTLTLALLHHLFNIMSVVQSTGPWTSDLKVASSIPGHPTLMQQWQASHSYSMCSDHQCSPSCINWYQPRSMTLCKWEVHLGHLDPLAASFVIYPYFQGRNITSSILTSVPKACENDSNYWYCPHSMWSRVYETVRGPSICQSYLPTAAACGRFVAVGRADRRYH